MQNRYTGDIGDFAKYGLLRMLEERYLLGVAWYLFPDESANNDGKYTEYLEQPDKWRHLDPALFDGLRSIVKSDRRSVQQIEATGLLDNAIFSKTPLAFKGRAGVRAAQRAKWFQNVLSELNDCGMVFADPDNGLCEDRTYAMGDRAYWKRLPLSEAHVLAAGRTGILYHHNSRRPGGHRKEIQHWLRLLGTDTLALYWTVSSKRTFFIVHPTSDIKRHIEKFARKWTPYFEFHALHESPTTSGHAVVELASQKGNRKSSKTKICPECNHVFKGRGWEGIDAHWKAKHESIMPYETAWPIIESGGAPSIEGSDG